MRVITLLYAVALPCAWSFFIPTPAQTSFGVPARGRSLSLRSTEVTDEVATGSASVSNGSSIFIDEDAMLEGVDKERLIGLAKRFLESKGGFGADADLLSPNFRFVGPVVGPLGKEEFLTAIGSVDIKTAFPDFEAQFHNFAVDPFESNRVWYIARGKGTNSGPLPPFAPTATNKVVVNPPQMNSLTFDNSGLVTKYTIGYVIDREVGNTGGLGGLYGILYAIGRGLPFPEAQPWQKSPQYALFQGLGGLVQRL
eukprot:CAMPEP_0182454718 /NCGR_PEP_ID=MMETSP1319-20130603/1227_1 /TAXON_ID=172717 /ORGANISM="Bolidomonas pacifica, Strain RCC208" /LENGTH=253 /DNA_ID=CAMNT_0024652739 /DNA_START=68 /DNA_END=826 /DNA_ORIENTATION=+